MGDTRTPHKFKDLEPLEHSSSQYFLLYFGKDPKDIHVTQLWFRGDSKPPSEIFNKGFTARGHSFDVLKHINPIGEHYYDKSAYISTSTSRDVATQFPKESGLQAFVYEINPEPNAVDVSAFIHEAVKENKLDAEDAAHLLAEKERAIPLKINPHNIKGAWPVEVSVTPLNGDDEFIYARNIKNEYIRNPGYGNAIGSKILHVSKVAGHGLMATGAVFDGLSLHEHYESSKITGNFKLFFQEVARVMGAWPGAFVLGRQGAIVGARVGSMAGPVGMASGAVIGGLAGSIVGYHSGGFATTKVYKAISDSSFIPPISLEQKNPTLSESIRHEPKGLKFKDELLFPAMQNVPDVRKTIAEFKLKPGLCLENNNYHSRFKDLEPLPSLFASRKDSFFQSTPLELPTKFKSEFSSFPLAINPEVKSYWNSIASKSEFPAFSATKLQSFEPSSSALVSSSLFGKSKGLSQCAAPTAWDRMREQGVQHFASKLTK